MSNSAMVGTALPQHLQALERANLVRLARAALKRRVARGETTVAEILLDQPWQANKMNVSELLMSQRRWGRMRCRRLLQSVSVPENKAIGTLTERQRLALAHTLEQMSAASSNEEAGSRPMELTAA